MTPFPEGPPITEDDDAFVQSFARGLAVLRAFGGHSPEPTLTEIADAVGLTRATTRRFLLTLESLGYVRRSARTFALTPRVLELGYSYLSSLGLAEIAQPHLDALCRAVGESTSVSVLDRDDIVYIARAQARRIIAVSLTIGSRMPAWVTAMGRVQLAALAPADRQVALDAIDFVAFTDRTIPDRAALEGELSRVADSGVSVVDGELESGLRSIAVPIVVGGHTIAAINIAMSAASDHPSDDELLVALESARAEIVRDLSSHRVGMRPERSSE